MVIVFRVETATASLWLIHFQIKRTEIGRKSIFQENQITNKVLLKFLDIKLLMERKLFRFWTLSTNIEGRVYVFIV